MAPFFANVRDSEAAAKNFIVLPRAYFNESPRLSRQSDACKRAVIQEFFSNISCDAYEVFFKDALAMPSEIDDGSIPNLERKLYKDIDTKEHFLSKANPNLFPSRLLKKLASVEDDIRHLKEAIATEWSLDTRSGFDVRRAKTNSVIKLLSEEGRVSATQESNARKLKSVYTDMLDMIDPAEHNEHSMYLPLYPNRRDDHEQSAPQASASKNRGPEYLRDLLTKCIYLNFYVQWGHVFPTVAEYLRGTDDASKHPMMPWCTHKFHRFLNVWLLCKLPDPILSRMKEEHVGQVIIDGVFTRPMLSEIKEAVEEFLLQYPEEEAHEFFANNTCFGSNDELAAVSPGELVGLPLFRGVTPTPRYGAESDRAPSTTPMRHAFADARKQSGANPMTAAPAGRARLEVPSSAVRLELGGREGRVGLEDSREQEREAAQNAARDRERGEKEGSVAARENFGRIITDPAHQTRWLVETRGHIRSNPVTLRSEASVFEPLAKSSSGLDIPRRSLTFRRPQELSRKSARHEPALSEGGGSDEGDEVDAHLRQRASSLPDVSGNRIKDEAVRVKDPSLVPKDSVQFGWSDERRMAADEAAARRKAEAELEAAEAMRDAAASALNSASASKPLRTSAACASPPSAPPAPPPPPGPSLRAASDITRPNRDASASTAACRAASSSAASLAAPSAATRSAAASSAARRAAAASAIPPMEGEAPAASASAAPALDAPAEAVGLLAVAAGERGGGAPAGPGGESMLPAVATSSCCPPSPPPPPPPPANGSICDGISAPEVEAEARRDAVSANAPLSSDRGDDGPDGLT